MARVENGVYIVLGEVNLLVTAMRRNSRWLTSHSHQDDEQEPLITSFSQLKDVLCSITDLSDITPDEFLGPFLSVIRSENTTGPVTGLALTSINKFLSYGLIEANNEIGAIATENIADAVTHARFVGTDPASDEVVLMKILHVLRTLMLTSSGSLLSNESVCEIMQSCFRICFEMRLSELLRKSAEHTLVDMVQLLFSRLPQFKEDAKLITSLRKLKMRTGGGTESSRSSKTRKKSVKTQHKAGKRSQPAQTAAVLDPSVGHNETGASCDAQGCIDGGSVSTSMENVCQQSETEPEESMKTCRPDSLAIEPSQSDITASTTYEVATISTTPVAYRGTVVDMGSELQESCEMTDRSLDSENHESTTSDSHYIWNSVSETKPAADVEANVDQPADPATGGADDSVSAVVVNHVDVSLSPDTEYVNTQGVRFTTLSGTSSEAVGPPVPYSLPCVRELLRFLVSLINPYDQHNTDVMIHMGLSLLTVALESGADYIGSFRSLLSLVKDDLAKNLIFLLKCERLSLFAASIRVCFLLFESMRGYLKLQLEMYLTKLMEIIVSESNRVSYEQREIALESIVQLLRIPGLVTELYLNYDCDLYCSNLFEDLMKLLSKNAFPVAGLYSTHLLSLDALLAVIDSIEQHCHHRILSSTAASAAGVTRSSDDTCSDVHESSTEDTSVVPPCPPASGFVMADKMTRDVHDWAQSSKTENLDSSKTHDGRLGSRIRPNRMKVSVVLPKDEELANVKRKKKIYQTGTEQFNVKPVKGITYLQENGLLCTPLDPLEVVTFLKENPKLDKKQIGEFISNKKYSSVLEAYQKSFNFEETRIDEALRMYLESFRLPGEAPVISYLLEHFAEHWHKTNGEPFANADAAFTLAYAVIMLNVDQHNVNAKKQSIPMTVENFKKNVSKVNGGKDFDQDMLDEVYNAIRNEEIVMPAEQVGLVRDNYLWKVLLKRSVTKEGEFIHAPTGAYDRDLFAIVWGPTVAALSFVFDKSNDEVIIQKAVSGFRKCAMISAHYGMSDVFDNLVISLCKFTTLLTSIDSAEIIPVLFGNNAKAQLAAKTVFGLAHRHSDILHDGWKNILDCMLQLYRAKLLAEVLITVEDFLDPNGRISLIREEAVSPQREPGVLSSFYSYFTLNDTPQQRGPTAEEQEAVRRAQSCIQECHVEQLIMESKFLRVDSLQELLKAMIYASRCPDSNESINSALCEEDTAVFFLELLIKVVLQNRDRMGSFWQSIQDHLYSLVVNATESTFLVERAVVGLLRLTIRLLRRDEIASQVLGSLRMLLMMKPDVIHSISRHIAYGLHDLLKTNAANIHTAYDWYTLFTLLEVVGAGTNPPPLMQCRPGVDLSQVLSDAGAQSDSELSKTGKQIAPADNSSDRGYTSDSELYDSRAASDASSTAHRAPSSHGSWMMLYRDDLDGGSSLKSAASQAVNQYSIVLCSNDECRAMMNHDTRSLVKCCETLAFLVRDAAHITPHNFTSCVHTIRTFVEASVDGGIRIDPRGGSHRQSTTSGGKKANHKHAKKQTSAMKTSRSSPGHLSAATDDDRDSESYQTVSIQLLDLMHTLHTKAASIYNSWAQESHTAASTTAVDDQQQQQPVDRQSLGLTDEAEAGTSALWTHCWCPLLQGIARFCCDARRSVRSQALTYLQRALLMHDLQTLTAVEWENCFNKVLFPLLSKLLEHINPQDPSGIEETRMRASTLLCKVFLQHLSPLLTLPTFTALWLTILEFMDKYMHADRSDLLSEAIPESLKNMLLVMHTAGILQQDVESDESKLWKLTWDRIDAFLPSLREEVFKPHDSERPAKREAAQYHHHDTSATPNTMEVLTHQPLPSSAPANVAAPQTESMLCTNDVASGSASAIQGGSSLPCVPPTGAQSMTQYVLHPPLPAVSSSSTPPDQLATIPLLLNPHILQSSAIPVISPQNSAAGEVPSIINSQQ